MRQKLKQQIDQLKAKGATYADVRWYPYEDQNVLVMHNGNLKALAASSESGAGVRVLYKGAWGFSASSNLADLDTLFEKALDNAKIASERVTFPIRLAEKDAIQDSFTSPNKIDPFNVPLGEKVDFLQKLDQALAQPGVMQRVAFFNFVKRQQIYIDSEGSEIEKNIIDVFPQFRVMGVDKDGGMQSRGYAPGRTGMTRGWESIRQPTFLAMLSGLSR
ncbi:MAG TPA: DNA gyrase modulator, partial [Anaerolineaceae bacterium]|nr:DNA gyrase modulator [Anaerolineaceae bacterium]